jgi:signal peptidase II|tara:strand:- start:590 stop:1144 length:555 start_codon:yes stop_codon:yes gene_type:complete
MPNAPDAPKQLKIAIKMKSLKFFSEKSIKLKFANNYLICLLIIVFTFSIDRVSKIKIINHQVNNGVVYINDFINFELIWNTGIAFGFLSSNSSIIYNSITLIITFVIIFLVYLVSKSSFSEKILFSIIIGGALGNFYDRYAYSAVPDFIDIHYKTFHWFTFNMADIFITIGIVALISKDLYFKK